MERIRGNRIRLKVGDDIKMKEHEKRKRRWRKRKRKTMKRTKL